MKPKDKIILALDVSSRDEAKKLVEELKDYVGAFKIGLELFTSEGPDFVKEIVNSGAKVFLDCKFHDIPNTVAGASAAASRLGVWMFNVHASGGSKMMAAAIESANKAGVEKRPLVIAVTVLTSIDNVTLNDELNVPGDVLDQVKNFALLSRKSGLDGVVCSPKEIAVLREIMGEDFIIVTPGVRPVWAGADDQKRFMTPKEAIDMGASYVVIGRPITKAENRVEAAKKIVDEIS